MKALHWYAKAGSTDLTFRDVDVARLWIAGARAVSVLGGDVGPFQNADPQVKSANGIVPTNILLDGVYFHDATKTISSYHTECLQFARGSERHHS